MFTWGKNVKIHNKTETKQLAVEKQQEMCSWVPWVTRPNVPVLILLLKPDMPEDNTLRLQKKKKTTIKPTTWRRVNYITNTVWVTMTLTYEIMKMNDFGRGLPWSQAMWLVNISPGSLCRALWAGNMLNLATKKSLFSAWWRVDWLILSPQKVTVSEQTLGHKQHV